MRIYKVVTEHTRYKAADWKSYRVAARTAEQATRKAKRKFASGERLQEVELIAEAEL